MARVVFDIETVAFPLDAFDQVQQDYLLRFANDEKERAEALQKLSLFPITAQIIVIGMLNPDTNRGKVLFQSQTHNDFTSEDGLVRFVTGTEEDLLRQFWKDIGYYDQYITFNGRSFDCPFLMLRSAIKRIPPSRNLMPYRFDPSIHCDLLEQFTFYGTLRKFSLDFYCKTFGVESPKSHGITGLDLGKLYLEGRCEEIARYCLGDLRATAELFRIWNQHLNIQDY
jgi:DNA polymerase III epsilon subunit-like protein